MIKFDFNTYVNSFIDENDYKTLMNRKEEVLDIIDNYCETGKFGVKAVMHCGSLHMHRSGRLV